MTNLAQIDVLKEWAKYHLSEYPVTTATILDLIKDLDAQADYAMKLREALEHVKHRGYASHFILGFDQGTVPIVDEALSLTPTEAMQQAKERYWCEGIRAVYEEQAWDTSEGSLEKNIAFILAELRKGPK